MPNAGADWIHVPLATDDSDFGALAGRPDRCLDLDRAVVDLWNLHLEQLDEKARVGAREDNLRALGLLVDLDDDRTNPLALAVAFVTGLLAARHHRLGPVRDRR